MNNKTFGTAASFGGSTSGSSTPFEQTSSAFGANLAASNVFAQFSFGAPPPNTGGLFGNTSQPPGSSSFGHPSNTFGAPASTSTRSFGFGAAPTVYNFGNTVSSTQNSNGLFGGSTSAFDRPQPAFGAFNTTNTGTALFGFSRTTPTGTTIKFNPTTGTDTLMRGGVSTSVGTRYQCLSMMKEYENKSLEEWRVEDYSANRKGGSIGGIVCGSTTPQATYFGIPLAALTSGSSFVNTTHSKPLFSNARTTFGPANVFCEPQQNQSTRHFGNSVSGFGAATTVAPCFTFAGPNTNSGAFQFGQNYQQKPFYGATTSSTGIFRNRSTTQAIGFGASGATNQPSKGLLGDKPTGFGTTSINYFNFGNASNVSRGGLLGKKPAAPAFGTQTSGFDSIPDEDLCKICMAATIDSLFLDCGHMVTCTRCGKRMKKCPICRHIVVRVVRVFKL